jgi:RNase P/RNase MRP subunit POP5
MNRVQPTMREKKRYICFATSSDASESVILKSVLLRIKRYIGEKNYDLSRPQIIQFENGKGIQ